MCRQSRDLYRPYRDTAQAPEIPLPFRTGPGLRAWVGGVTGTALLTNPHRGCYLGA